MREIFDKYVFNFDMNDNDINYKYYHSYRVMELMDLLADKLGFNEYDKYLALVIGLFHDIGRFEQLKRYESYSDELMDHALCGVKVIKGNNLLDKLSIKKDDYEVVYKAILWHNKFKVIGNFNERELMFIKLIRDADKLDILYAQGNDDIKAELRQDDKEISLEINTSFYKEEPADIKYVKSSNDWIMISFSFIYDINFRESFEIIKDRGLYEKIYERIIRKDIFSPYMEKLRNYIDDKINKVLIEKF